MADDEILQAILKELKDVKYLLERIAQREGCLGRQNEARIREYLITNGKAIKQEICSLCKVSDNTAVKLMKRLSQREGIVYIPGHGKHPSSLFYDDGKSLESKALRLLREMPRKSRLTREELVKKLELGPGDSLHQIVSFAGKLSDGEIFWQNGEVVRGR